MAPMMQGVCSACKTAADNIAPPRHKCIGSTISVGKVVGETWERQWRKKSQFNGFKVQNPPPMHKRGEACRYLPWGGGSGWGNKKDVFLAVAATV
eukprot:4482194-Ditylum_brightwellii.AAC.1